MTTAKTDEKTSPEKSEEQPEFEPIMELDTLAAPRKQVLIRTAKDREGKLYEIRSPKEFGIADEATIRAEVREYSELVQKDDRNGSEKKKLEARLHTLLGKILVAPPAVRGEVFDRDAQSIITFFTTALFAEDAVALERAMTAREFDGSITAN